MKFRKLFESDEIDETIKVLSDIVKKADKRFKFDHVGTTDYFGDNYDFSFETPEGNDLSLSFTLDQDCCESVNLTLMFYGELPEPERKLFNDTIKNIKKALGSYSKGFSGYREQAYDADYELTWSVRSPSRPKGEPVRIEI